MIRIERVPLPDGLRALAHRDPDGGLLIYVSSTLDAPVQRTAVMAAVRASRRSGGRTAAPLGLALLVGLRVGLGSWRVGLGSWRGARPALRRSVTLARHVGHVRHVGWAAGGSVAVGAVAVGLILSSPARPHPSDAPPAAGRTSQPSAGSARAGGKARPTARTTTAAAGTLAGQPQAARHSLAGRPSAPSTPTLTPTSAPSPSRSPTPSPAPTTGPPGTCVIVLGIRVCVPVSVSASASAGG